MEALDLSKKDEKKEKKLKDFIFNYLKYTTLGFEEWMSLNQNMDSMIQTNKALAKKLSELKELLKEWAWFETEENPKDFTVISERMSELANKTNQALGEDK